MLGANASKACQYTYPFQTVREFIDFSMKITRLGESGTLGFLPHLNAQAAAALINEAITTESRQEFAFRQFEGLFPVPVSNLWRGDYPPMDVHSLQIVLVHAFYHSKYAMDHACAVYHSVPCGESKAEVAELPRAEYHGEHSTSLVPDFQNLVSGCPTPYRFTLTPLRPRSVSSNLRIRSPLSFISPSQNIITVAQYFAFFFGYRTRQTRLCCPMARSQTRRCPQIAQLFPRLATSSI
jgi:hypothetical protein